MSPWCASLLRRCALRVQVWGPCADEEHLGVWPGLWSRKGSAALARPSATRGGWSPGLSGSRDADRALRRLGAGVAAYAVAHSIIDQECWGSACPHGGSGRLLPHAV